MSETPRSLRAYVRAVEQSFDRLRGTPAVLSQRDWHRVAGWYREGIPVGVVLDALASRAARPPRSLAAIAPTVEEAWRTVRSGTIAGARRRAPDESRDHVAALRAAAERLSEERALARVLRDLASRAEAGEAAEALDAALDRALPELTSSDRLERARRDSERAMAEFRGRMQETAYAETLLRSTVARLRRELDLPRLTAGS